MSTNAMIGALMLLSALMFTIGIGIAYGAAQALISGGVTLFILMVFASAGMKK